MQKFDHRSLKYGIIGTQERVLARQGKQAIRVRAIEVLLYLHDQDYFERDKHILYLNNTQLSYISGVLFERENPVLQPNKYGVFTICI